MVAKFRAMRTEDFEEHQFLANSFTGDPYDWLNTSPCVTYTSDKAVLRDVSEDYMRTHIKLTAPTFNFVLGQSNCSLLWKLLGVGKNTSEAIINFSKVYDTLTGELVGINDTDEMSDYLFGAQIAEKYIDDFDIDEAILDTLYIALKSVLSMTANPRDVFSINTSGEGFNLAAEYYATYDPEVLLDKSKRGLGVDEIQSTVQDALLANENSRFTLLYNMPRDKSSLYGMLNYQIMVIPLGMRPKLDNREHQITKLYAPIITANEELQMILGTATPILVANVYKRLELAVEALQYNAEEQLKNVKDAQSLMSRIKSKTGQIRLRNLGKRQDYSGRAVVCINPYLPLDYIRIPRAMLPKLLEYHVLPFMVQKMEENQDTAKESGPHSRNNYDKIKLSNLSGNIERKEMLKIIEEQGLVQRIPFAMGRQPTLHKQSLLGFHVEITDFSAIEVNPLICEGYNMDFDGDQAHIEVPLSPEAIEEVNRLLMVTQNLFYAKDGSVISKPRMDMLYGLYLCTRNTYALSNQAVRTVESLEGARQLVMKHKVKPWETIFIPKYNHILAGDAAFLACFPEGELALRGQETPGKLAVTQVDKKSVNKYISYIMRVDSENNFVHRMGTGYDTVDSIVGIINRLVETGFRVARIYPPNMSLLQSSILNAQHAVKIEEFHKDVESIELFYNLGLETHDRYSTLYGEKVDKVMDFYKNDLAATLEDKNGYKLLMESGARGNADNLRQTFGIKGSVQKNDTENFDAIIENSYSTGLTPLEHCVDAFGGRQGQIDKSLKTGDTGYAMRKMWHATQGLSICCKDCGTTEGLRITKADLRVFSSEEEDNAVKKDVEKIFEHAVTGRFDMDGRMINAGRAKQLASDPDVKSIVIRSPMFCKNPCCQKCYGVDWSTHKIAVIGLPIGLIAAQSIGEPGTQLTLKQFQKGGVTGANATTSAFDKVDAYTKVQDIAKASREGKYNGYDPVAWADGDIIVTPTKNEHMVKIKIEGHRRSIDVPDSLVVKAKAVKGEGLSVAHGDYSLHELMKYAGIDYARFYLAFKLFALYRSEIEIKMCHFETLVAQMTRYMIVKTTRPDLLVGQYCSAPELYAGPVNPECVTYIPRIISTRAVPNASMSALDAIDMESQVRGLSRVCALHMTDNLKKPINNMVLGRTIADGSSVPTFMDDRCEPI